MIYLALALIIAGWAIQLWAYINKDTHLSKLFLFSYTLGVFFLILDGVHSDNLIVAAMNAGSFLLSGYLLYMRHQDEQRSHSIFAFIRGKRRSTNFGDAEVILRNIIVIVLLTVSFYSFGIWVAKGAKPTQQHLKIGLNIERSGVLSSVGKSSEQAATMIVDQINDAGGIYINGTQYPIDLIVKDNGSTVNQTKQVTNELIQDENVIAIIGPNASKYAIAASDIAENYKTLMISPWSTDPTTTLNLRTGRPKQFVYRAAFLDPFQGKALAQFSVGKQNYKRLGVMFDKTAAVLQGQADYFKAEIETENAKVVSMQSFSAGDLDFTKQLRDLKNAKVDAVFLPAYYSDAATIIKQAHKLGITVPFLGSDAWGSSDILRECGSDCENYYLSAHYSPLSDTPQVKRFVTEFHQRYKHVPDDVAALTYDSFGILFNLMRHAENTNKESIGKAAQNLGEFNGVTGYMKYAGNGDPQKSIVILKINNGEFNFVTSVDPQ